MAKRLIVCCDGTWNTPKQVKTVRADGQERKQSCPTNVTRIALSIAATDSKGTRQLVYYHPGVGTGRWDHLRGGAFGMGLSANVRDAYRFLVDNYEEGDELYFFGFSRGAFTARSTAGLVRNCGILRRENLHRINEAYALYRDWRSEPRGMSSTLFRNAFSYEPKNIRFIGVWDTVGALGIPPMGPRFLHKPIGWFNRRWSFHDTDLSTRVKAAFHALSIDEQRKAFRPALWKQQPGADGQVLEQVWFAGVHSDVGGGLQDASLSDIALLWMVQKAQEHELEFDPNAFTAGAPRDAAALDPGTSTTFTVAPAPNHLPHISRKGVYLLVRPWNRPIGVQGGDDGGDEQAVAQTALQLREHEPTLYQPPELLKYLQQAHRKRPAEVPLTFVPTHR